MERSVPRRGKAEMPKPTPTFSHFFIHSFIFHPYTLSSILSHSQIFTSSCYLSVPIPSPSFMLLVVVFHQQCVLCLFYVVLSVLCVCLLVSLSVILSCFYPYHVSIHTLTDFVSFRFLVFVHFSHFRFHSHLSFLFSFTSFTS